MGTLIGGASYYDLPGQTMADGEPFQGRAMTAAMLHVRLGSVVQVEALNRPGHAISVTVTDRGPYVAGRVIDLTPAAFRALEGDLGAGVVQVKVITP